MQFVVTTHSPLVLSSFDRNELIVLEADSNGLVNTRTLDRTKISLPTLSQSGKGGKETTRLETIYNEHPYKGDEFPTLRGKNFDYSKKSKLDKERRAFVDPVTDVTDGWFGIVIEDGEWKQKSFPLSINDQLGRTEKKRCEYTCEQLKLNSDSILMRDRQRVMTLALKYMHRAIAGDPFFHRDAISPTLSTNRRTSPNVVAFDIGMRR